MKWIFLVLALQWLQPSLAIRAIRGPCPTNMTSVAYFDINRYMGKWYKLYDYPSVPLKIAKCQSVNFYVEEAIYYIETRELSSQTDTVKFRKAEIKLIDGRNGRYIQDTKSKAFPEGIQIYIVDTDYDNYAIRFMCFDSRHIFSYHWASIEFRKRLPSADIIYRAKAMASENGIIVKDMVKIPQDACPPDT